MPKVLSALAPERGTYVIDVSFFDENEASVVPNSVTWTLTDALGTVINSRTEVSATPAATVSIVLSGDDLDIDDTSTRNLTVEALYTSNLGVNLPLKEWALFYIDDNRGVS